MNRIIVTGSRDWSDTEIIRNELALARQKFGDQTVLVHGDCPTGADAIAAKIWSGWNLPMEAHPADWSRHGRSAGPKRNQHMVNLGADLCLGFPLGESRGTRGCLKFAQQANIPTKIIEI